MTKEQKLQLIRGIWNGDLPLSILLGEKVSAYVEQDRSIFFREGKEISEQAFENAIQDQVQDDPDNKVSFSYGVDPETARLASMTRPVKNEKK